MEINAYTHRGSPAKADEYQISSWKYPSICPVRNCNIFFKTDSDNGLTMVPKQQKDRSIWNNYL